MISQQAVMAPLPIGQILGRGLWPSGAGVEVVEPVYDTGSVPATGCEFALGAWRDSVPLIVHPAAVDVCDPEDIDCVARVEDSIMQLAPQIRRTRFESLSQVLRWFCICEGSWRALETLYTYGKAGLPGRPGNVPLVEEATALRFFRADLNARAVRERARIVASLVYRLICRAGSTHSVRMVSIASGSARAVLTGIREARRPVSLRLIDNNRMSLNYSAEQLVAELNIEADIACKLGNVAEIGRQLDDDASIDIAEAVGILDYFDDESAVQLLAQTRARLADGGTLIASNIMDNRARAFLHTAVGWRPMHYRTVDEFVELFIRAGFVRQQLMAHLTPSDAVYVIVEAH